MILKTFRQHNLPSYAQVRASGEILSVMVVTADGRSQWPRFSEHSIDWERPPVPQYLAKLAWKAQLYTQKTKIMYKVVAVSQISDNLSSVIAAGTGAGVQYYPQNWTVPKIGKLFVFRELDQALGFAEGYSSSKTYSCLAVNPVQIKDIVSANRVLATEHYWSKGSLEAFWSGETKMKYSFTWPPPGTMVCDAVYLIEENIQCVDVP